MALDLVDDRHYNEVPDFFWDRLVSPQIGRYSWVVVVLYIYMFIYIIYSL